MNKYQQIIATIDEKIAQHEAYIVNLKGFRKMAAMLKSEEPVTVPELVTAPEPVTAPESVKLPSAAIYKVLPDTPTHNITSMDLARQYMKKYQNGKETPFTYAQLTSSAGSILEHNRAPRGSSKSWDMIREAGSDKKPFRYFVRPRRKSGPQLSLSLPNTEQETHKTRSVTKSDVLKIAGDFFMEYSSGDRFTKKYFVTGIARAMESREDRKYINDVVRSYLRDLEKEKLISLYYQGRPGHQEWEVL